MKKKELRKEFFFQLETLWKQWGAVEQAMEGLKISEEEKSKYLDELKKCKSTKYINFENRGEQHCCCSPYCIMLRKKQSFRKWLTEIKYSL